MPIQSPIFAPAIALVLWSLFMLAWLAVTRLPAMARAGIALDKIVGSRGVNLKIASDEPRYDRGGNRFLRNTFLDAEGPHILFRSVQPPGDACGNTFGTTRITERGTLFASASIPCPR